MNIWKNYSKRKFLLLLVVCIATIVVSVITQGILSKAGSVATNTFVSSLPADRLYVEVDSSNDTEIDVISTWQDENGAYYLFLPSSVDEQNITVWSTFSQDLYIDSKFVSSGESISFEEGLHCIQAGNISYSLNVMKSASIPSIHITLDDNKTIDYLKQTKSNKASGIISFIDSDGTTQEVELSQIKGRGNSSWDAGAQFDKYPYNIKLDKKTDVFGMGKYKKWCLLANVFDETMVRNLVVNDLAEAMELDYSTSGTNADLYVNGEYIGTYVICEKVEAGDGELVEIADLEKATEEVNDQDLDAYNQVDPYGDSYVRKDEDHDGYPDKYLVDAGVYKYYDIPNNPDDITGGYLLEFDYPERQAEEASGFVTDRYQAITMKAPEYASEEQVLYIKDYMQRVEDAVYSSDGYNSKGEHYSDLIDVESFAKVYLINEFTKNLDSGESSYYLYKDANSKIYCGPVWDYDWALGAYDVKAEESVSDPSGWYACNKKIDNALEYGYNYYNLGAQLCKHDDFMKVVKEIWNNVFSDAANGLLDGNYEGIVTLDEHYSRLEASASMNYIVNDIIDLEPIWGSADTGSTFEDNYSYLKNFVSKRLLFMEQLSGDIDFSETLDSECVYFDNSSLNWDKVYCYYWKTNSDGSIAWPGMAMSSVGSGIYSYKIPDGYDCVIFNDGSGNQTVDLSVTKGSVFVPTSLSGKIEGTWNNLSNDDSDNNDNQNGSDDNLTGNITIGSTTVCFDNSITKWGTVYCYYWSDGQSGSITWPGTKMSLLSGNVYCFEVPNGNNVIFTDGNGNQTVDLSASFGKVFCPDSATGKISGSWQDYGYIIKDNNSDVDRVVYYNNTTTNWNKVYCYYWISGSNGSVIWPGVEMTLDGNKVYSIEVPEGNDSVIFTDGNGNQTVDLELNIGKIFNPSSSTGSINGNWEDVE